MSEALPPPLPAAAPALLPPAAPPAAAPAPPGLMRQATVDFAVAGLCFIVSTLLVVVPVVFYAMATAPGAMASEAAMERRLAEILPTLVVAAIFAMLVAALVSWALRRGSLARPLPALRPAPAFALAALAGVLIQAYAVGMAALSASLGQGLEPSNAEPLQKLFVQTPWLAIATIVLVAPLAEELLFRHVLLRRFALHGRPLTGLLLTSLVFASMHEIWPGDAGVLAWLLTVLLYVGMGVGFGLVYLRTGRYWAAVAAHAVCNACAIGLMLATTA